MTNSRGRKRSYMNTLNFSTPSGTMLIPSVSRGLFRHRPEESLLADSRLNLKAYSVRYALIEVLDLSRSPRRGARLDSKA